MCPLDGMRSIDMLCIPAWVEDVLPVRVVNLELETTEPNTGEIPPGVPLNATLAAIASATNSLETPVETGNDATAMVEESVTGVASLMSAILFARVVALKAEFLRIEIEL